MTTTTECTTYLMSRDIRYTFPLLRKKSSDVVGGKAASLYDLARKGMPVPETLVISATAFERFSRTIAPDLDSCAGELSDVRSISGYCENLGRIIARRGIDHRLYDPIQEEIEAAFGKRELIFRSSAIGEDSAENSFAGQLESVVTDGTKDFREACRDALLGCWISFWQSKSIGYQLHRNTILGGLAVVVQPYIDAKLSGVLFTSHPLSARGTDRPFLLECVTGSGDALVSGRKDPERFLIHSAGRGLWVENCSGDGKDNRFLSPSMSSMEALVDMARLIVRNTRHEQDIEWTVDGAGKLYILQSRPVTVLAPEKGRRLAWSNVNVNENFPEALTPFLMSFAKKGYYHYFRNLAGLLGVSRRIRRHLEHTFETIIDFHQSRMYYNLSNIYTCLSAFPLPDLARQYWDSFIGIYDLPYEDVQRKLLPQNRLLRMLYLLKVLSFSLVHVLRLPHCVRRFERRVDSHVERCASGERGRTAERYKTDIDNFMNIRMYGWKDASLADALAMFGYGLLHSAVKRYAPSLSNSTHLLLVGIPGLVSHASQQRLWELARLIQANPTLQSIFDEEDPTRISSLLKEQDAGSAFLQAFARYQREWGYRISGELLLTKAGYDEAPEKLIDLLKGYLRNSSPSPEEQLEAQTRRRREVTAQILAHVDEGSGPLAGLFRKTLIRLSLLLAQRGIRYRERARLKQARLYNQCRHSLLAFGTVLEENGLLPDAEDALFLTYPEIKHLSSCHARSLLGEIIKRRKSRYAGDQITCPPDSFCLSAGEHFGFSRKTEAVLADIASDMKESILTGFGACEGKVIGKVRILEDVSLMGTIEKGDILVAKQTDPGWAPVFPLVSGVILERGGMLSHGAIVAREYGIPTLVGVKHATSRLTNGQLILLDADRSAVFPCEAR